MIVFKLKTFWFATLAVFKFHITIPHNDALFDERFQIFQNENPEIHVFKPEKNKKYAKFLYSSSLEKKTRLHIQLKIYTFKIIRTYFSCELSHISLRDILILTAPAVFTAVLAASA